MRVVWAVGQLQSSWTELMYKMLVCSVQSWKEYNPGTTTVLYASKGILKGLTVLGKTELWDEVYEDKDSYLSGCYTQASWDYPKVEALHKEQEKVLYVDYDILFRGEILSKLDSNYNWFWCSESTNFEYYYRKNEKIEGLPDYLRKEIYHGEIAYNTGMLYVDKEYLEAWRNTYLKVFPAASRYIDSSKATKFSLTIGQSNIVGIVPKETVRFVGDLCGDVLTHFLGWYKKDPSCELYREQQSILNELYPDPEFSRKYQRLRIV